MFKKIAQQAPAQTPAQNQTGAVQGAQNASIGMGNNQQQTPGQVGSGSGKDFKSSNTLDAVMSQLGVANQYTILNAEIERAKAQITAFDKVFQENKNRCMALQVVNNFNTFSSCCRLLPQVNFEDAVPSEQLVQDYNNVDNSYQNLIMAMNQKYEFYQSLVELRVNIPDAKIDDTMIATIRQGEGVAYAEIVQSRQQWAEWQRANRVFFVASSNGSTLLQALDQLIEVCERGCELEQSFNQANARPGIGMVGRIAKELVVTYSDLQRYIVHNIAPIYLEIAQAGGGDPKRIQYNASILAVRFPQTIKVKINQIKSGVYNFNMTGNPDYIKNLNIGS